MMNNPYQFPFPNALPPQQQQGTGMFDFLQPQGNPYSTPVGAPYNPQIIQASQAMASPSVYQGLMNTQDQGFSLMQGLQQQPIASTTNAANPSLWNQLTDFAGSEAFGNTINAAKGLAGSWLGFQQLGQAQEQFDFTKSSWQTQYADQKTAYNKEIADREARRASAAK